MSSEREFIYPGCVIPSVGNLMSECNAHLVIKGSEFIGHNASEINQQHYQRRPAPPAGLLRAAAKNAGYKSRLFLL